MSELYRNSHFGYVIFGDECYTVDFNYGYNIEHMFNPLEYSVVEDVVLRICFPIDKRENYLYSPPNYLYFHLCFHHTNFCMHIKLFNCKITNHDKYIEFSEGQIQFMDEEELVL